MNAAAALRRIGPARGERLGAWRGLAARRRFAVLLAAALFALASLFALSSGPSGLGAARLAEILLSSVGLGGAASEREWGVLLHLRGPRWVLGTLVGAALALGGAGLQALLRNPLVEPGLVGTSAGASFGAVAWIVLGAGTLGASSGALQSSALLLVSFVAALAATGVVLWLAGRSMGSARLLLVGVALSAILGAGTGLCLFTADDAALRDATFWTLGSLSRATWGTLAVGAPCLLLASLALLGAAQTLDCLQLGDKEAGALGLDVARAKRRVVAWVALAVAAAVSMGGTIGFVGLLVPHLARLLVGGSHRVLLPVCALLGAAGLVAADGLARVAAAPAELPIGVLTAAVGGPCFLALLLGLGGRRTM